MIKALDFAVEIVESHLEGYPAEERQATLQDIVEHGCVSGVISSVVYTTDINRYFSDNLWQVLEYLDEYKEETEFDLMESLTTKSDTPHQDLPGAAIWFAVEEAALQMYESGEYEQAEDGE